MTSKLGGRPTKDASISDAFNQLKVGEVLTKKDFATAKRAAKTEKLRQDEEKRKVKVTLDKLKERVDSVTAKAVTDLKAIAPEKVEPEPPVPEVNIQEEEKAAHQMLQHLRYAYRNSVGPTGLKGRARLLELLENDTEFKFAVRELVKVDTALMAAKIRKDGDGGGIGVGQQNFFVVLKGLEDEKKFLTAGAEDKTVDMKQITRAMNPEENSYEPEEEVSKRDAPEQLQKPVEGMEG